MKSLEERHAYRQRLRKEGIDPVVVEPDAPVDAPKEDEDEREPMRNKGPGTSRTAEDKPVEVVGNTETPNTRLVVGSTAVSGTGNGTGVADTANTVAATQSWQANTAEAATKAKK